MPCSAPQRANTPAAETLPGISPATPGAPEAFGFWGSSFSSSFSVPSDKDAAALFTAAPAEVSAVRCCGAFSAAWPAHGAATVEEASAPAVALEVGAVAEEDSP